MTHSNAPKKLDRIPPAAKNAKARALMRLAARLTGPYDELTTLEAKAARGDAAIFDKLAEAIRRVHRKLFNMASEAEILDMKD